LGLSICQSIVSQMRGKMRIESEVGRGTTVRISLPLPQESNS
jgi:signal transduction histidine kinase